MAIGIEKPRVTAAGMVDGRTMCAYEVADGVADEIREQLASTWKTEWELKEIMEIRNCFVEKCSYTLKRIEYDQRENAVGELHIEIEDDIANIVVGAHEMSFDYARCVHFEPDALLRLSVVCGVVLLFDDDFEPDYTLDEDDWKRAIYVNANRHMKRVAAMVSLLIGEITAVSRLGPLVTPPQLMPLRDGDHG